MPELLEEVHRLLFEAFGLKGLNAEQPIFSAKVLDSMDVLRLIMELETRFAITIPVFEVSIDMFDSPKSIAELVSKRK